VAGVHKDRPPNSKAMLRRSIGMLSHTRLNMALRFNTVLLFVDRVTFML
jgi:hypothetical protein